ncbi:hypothetical protein P879_07043 [Paragonimus westermani]|uniref:Uncharacterized protein n=1 Tax=Paragonimus westermani TaxID=34504 RepID=A0A8T0D365_9TREM|nr:hypothetical protein P879_07043 [Paragonimus westermani]
MTGAFAIRRRQANIYLPLLMAGNLRLSELEQTHRCAVMAPIKLSTFMLNKERYLATLREITHLNEISIMKRVTEKQRSRSQALSCDQNTVPLTSGNVPVITPASFHTPMPLTSKQPPPPLGSFSTSEDDELAKQEETKKRCKHVRATDRTSLPILDSVCSGQKGAQVTKQPGPKVSKTLSKLERKMSPSFPGRPTSSDSILCGMGICSVNTNPMHSARQAVRTRIMQALSDFQFSISQLSNSLLRTVGKATG